MSRLDAPSSEERVCKEAERDREAAVAWLKMCGDKIASQLTDALEFPEGVEVVFDSSPRPVI